MPVIVCEDDWYKDVFHTASDSPCVLPAGWLRAMMVTGIIGLGLTSLVVAATIAMLRHFG